MLVLKKVELLCTHNIKWTLTFCKLGSILPVSLHIYVRGEGKDTYWMPIDWFRRWFNKWFDYHRPLNDPGSSTMGKASVQMQTASISLESMVKEFGTDREPTERKEEDNLWEKHKGCPRVGSICTYKMDKFSNQLPFILSKQV